MNGGGWFLVYLSAINKLAQLFKFKEIVKCKMTAGAIATKQTTKDMQN